MVNCTFGLIVVMLQATRWKVTAKIEDQRRQCQPNWTSQSAFTASLLFHSSLLFHMTKIIWIAKRKKEKLSSNWKWTINKNEEKEKRWRREKRDVKWFDFHSFNLAFGIDEFIFFAVVAFSYRFLHLISNVCERAREANEAKCRFCWFIARMKW